jgi:hypothetical protein
VGLLGLQHKVFFSLFSPSGGRENLFDAQGKTYTVVLCTERELLDTDLVGAWADAAHPRASVSRAAAQHQVMRFFLFCFFFSVVSFLF